MMQPDNALRRQIGQLLIFGFEGLIIPDSLIDLIRTHYLGNVILFSRNVRDKDQLTALTTSLQELARNAGHDLPLAISADQENGIVRRLPSDLLGLPGNMALGATGDPHNALRTGHVTGQLLKALGINFNLAPVLDVNNNPDNPVIGVRSFGDSAPFVADFGIQFIHGLQSQGVVACGKHFPGHGDTDTDSHLDLPIIRHRRDRLERIELLPFKAAIAAHIDSLMTAHVVFPAVEPEQIPATLSSRVLTDLLRNQLGFEGVITTDCLEMNAISQTIGVARGAVRALKAGADMVMVSHRLDYQRETIDAIVTAVRSGELPLSRITSAYERVNLMKKTRLQTPPDNTSWTSLRQTAQKLQKTLAAEAVTLLTRSIPHIPRALSRVAVLVDEQAPLMVAAGSSGSHPLLRNAIEHYAPLAHVEEYLFPTILEGRKNHDVLRQLASFDFVLVGINGGQNHHFIDFVRALNALPIPQATFLLRNPYDARLVPKAPNLVALYENTPWMAEAALRGVFGEKMTGRLPVSVSTEFPRGYPNTDPEGQ